MLVNMMFALLVTALALFGGFSASAQIAPPTAASPNYTALWWNPNESGWGLNLTHQENIIFATMFSYRDAGLGNQNPPMWYVGSALAKQPDGSYFGEWYSVVGSAFNAVPFVPLTPDRITSVGTARIAFSGNTGTIVYSVNGVTVTKTMEKQVYGLAPADCKFTDNPDRRLATNYQDLWWNPNESGWGVNFTHQYAGPPRGEILFATMFTYHNAGAGDRNPPMWYVASEMIKQPDGSFYGLLYQTTGSAFNAVPFVPLTPDRITPVGAMRFTPIDGETGSLVFSVNGVTVVKTITRQVYRYPVFVCTTVTTPQSTYTDKVYAIWTDAYPYAVTKTSVTKVVNKTSYTTPRFGLFNCGAANKPLADGKVLMDCQDWGTLKRHFFYIDPLKDEMYDYSGVVPADITFTYVTNNADKPEWSAKVKVSDGWYFTTFDVTWVLKFQFDQGGAIITVKEGTFAVDGNIRVLASYSH